jgi:peptidoglycan/xylan/chitin deacetylase (PgdA/CDA1 family)
MIKNFLFHRVNPNRDKLWDPMDVNLFNKCIEYISNKYQVVLFEEIAFSDELINAKNKYATIMFDDGYKDNIEYAAPILQKHNVKAPFYVVTDSINNNVLTWTHILEYIFQFTDVINIELDFDFLPKEFKVIKLNSIEDRIKFINKFKPFIKTIPHENRQLILSQIFRSFKDVDLPRIMMSWEDLRQLKRCGHYIGSHTVTHSMLGTMSDKKEIRKELEDSRVDIRNNLGHFPITISYPVGSFNKTTKEISKEVGYKIGLAVKQNVFNPKKEDLFEVPRIELYNEPWWKTKLRITNTLENIKSLVGYR